MKLNMTKPQLILYKLISKFFEKWTITVYRKLKVDQKYSFFLKIFNFPFHICLGNDKLKLEENI